MPLPTEGYIAIAGSADWIQKFMVEWQLDQQTGGGDFDLNHRLRRWCQDSPDSAIPLLIALSNKSLNIADQTEVADGIEWLLMHHGITHWEAVNDLCRQLPAFRAVMSHVWGTSLSKDLRRKIEMWRV